MLRMFQLMKYVHDSTDIFCKFVLDKMLVRDRPNILIKFGLQSLIILIYCYQLTFDCMLLFVVIILNKFVSSKLSVLISSIATQQSYAPQVFNAIMNFKSYPIWLNKSFNSHK